MLNREWPRFRSSELNGSAVSEGISDCSGYRAVKVAQRRGADNMLLLRHFEHTNGHG